MLYLAYFDQTAVCTGDVHVFQQSATSPHRLALDLYRERTDQQDLISLAVTCSGAIMPVVRRHLRALFDQARCRITYEEGHMLASVLRILDPTRYPLLIDESGYPQQMLVVPA